MKLAWPLIGLLFASAIGQAIALRQGGSGFATLPIFVPASLKYEQQLRADRNEPAGKGGGDAAALAQVLLNDPAAASVAPQLAQLRELRAQLLDARNRRHALNIRMMDVGVAVARELSPAQWDAIHMNRDGLRARSELASYDRLLEKIR